MSGRIRTPPDSSSLLFQKIAVLHHAGQLRHAAQGDLSPSAASLRRAQRTGKRGGLARQRLQLRAQAAEGLLTRAFQFANVDFQPLERLAQRPHHALDGGLLLGQLARDLRAGGLQGGARCIQERTLIGPQRGIGQRPEGFAQLRRGLVGELLGGFQTSQPRPHPQAR